MGKQEMLGLIIAVYALISCSKDCHASDTFQVSSTVGKEFYIGILRNFWTGTGAQILVSAKQPGSVTFEIPSVGINETHAILNGTAAITIDYHAFHLRNGTIDNKGIKVTADVDIALTIITNSGDNCDGFLALPVQSLSTEYIVSAYRGAGGHDEFLIVAVGNNTNVKVQPRLNNVNANYSFNIRLDAMETYLFQRGTDLSGLSGTLIHSDKPVAVFSGTEYTKIPVGAGNRADYIVEEMIPATEYGRDFIVPHMAHKTNYLVRVYTNTDNTTISFTNSSSSVSKSINEPGEFLVLHLTTDPLVIRGSKPLLVVQYSFSQMYNGEAGGVFMTLVPAVNQYMTSYKFTVPSVWDYSSFNHHLQVIIKNEKLSGLMLDGHVMKNSLSSKNISFNGILFAVNIYRMTTGPHTLSHQQDQPFGAMLSGYSKYDGYGYPLGLSFNHESLPTLQTFPTTIQTSQTTSAMSQTVLSTLPVASYEDVMCLNCKELSHLYLCDTVARCRPLQMCYVEKYITHSGQIRFDTGCRDPSYCQSSSPARSDTCITCCSGDYCNTQGCGDPGLPPRNLRGPMCFDCPYVSSVDECDTVTMCAEYEVCSIVRHSLGSLFNRFSTSCSSQQCTHSKRFVPEKNERSTPVCHKCCSEDFCNTACNETTHISAIIG